MFDGNISEWSEYNITQGSYTNGQLKFQDFSRTFQVNILKNPGPDEG